MLAFSLGNQLQCFLFINHTDSPLFTKILISFGIALANITLLNQPIKLRHRTRLNGIHDVDVRLHGLVVGVADPFITTYGFSAGFNALFLLLDNVITCLKSDDYLCLFFKEENFFLFSATFLKKELWQTISAEFSTPIRN